MLQNYQPFYQKLIIPDEKDLYIISDVHGMHALYKEGCKRLGIKDSDVVISLGDLGDRGKENLKMFVEFTQKENRYMVLGNHEKMMMDALSDRNWYHCWYQNGGHSVLDEVGESGMEVLCKWLNQKPIVLEVHHRGKKLGFIHGGIPCKYESVGFEYLDTTWDQVLSMLKTDKGRESLMWDRNTLEAFFYHKENPKGSGKVKPVLGIDYVFHGHSYVEKPLHIENRIYTDTGSVFNGKLCFTWLDGDNINHYITGEDEE
ncbi:serine/threonine-protein phosphatase 2 [Klebsiella phage KP13-16]|nr:serine/threonine-protein phosphatase 2 [Klebsiella phage KP13-16]